MSKDVILTFGARIPILGVCLGHQCIAEAYGGEIVRASRLMHGKASTITHNGNSLFSDLATSFRGWRDLMRLWLSELHCLAVSKSLQKATMEKSWRSAISGVRSIRSAVPSRVCAYPRWQKNPGAILGAIEPKLAVPHPHSSSV